MNALRYLAFYLLGGLVAMLAQIVADPHSTLPNLGASGAIAAMMGELLVIYPSDRIRPLLFFFVFVRIRFIPGSVAEVHTGGVAYLAHMGGAVFEAATAHLFEDPQRLAA